MSGPFNLPFFVNPRVAGNVEGALASQGSPSYTGVALHTSAQAIPIPIMWGTRRLSPNVIWQSTLYSAKTIGGGWSLLNFGLVPTGGSTLDCTDAGGVTDPSSFTVGTSFLGEVFITHTGGGTSDYGSNDGNNSDSRFWVPMVMALCEGPVSSPPLRVWNGGSQPPLPWSHAGDQLPPPPGFSPALPPSLFYQVLTGTSTQAVWDFWSSSAVVSLMGLGFYVGENLAYRYTACIATPVADCGHTQAIPQQSFEIERILDSSYSLPDSYSLGVDYSPAGYLVDLLTSAQYGMGLQTSDIDSTSLANYRNYCGAQGLFFSPLLTAQIAGTDFMDRTAQISNSWIYWAGTAFYFVPLGDEALSANGYTFTPSTTPAYALSVADFLQPLQVDRADAIDCANRLRIEISDRLNDYSSTPIEWKNTTLITQFGLRDASSISADDICDSAVGAKVVELVGKRLAYLRNTYTFTVSYKMILLLPGTLITLTDPTLGLVNVPARVRSIDEDTDGGLQIVAEEYPGTLGISRPIPGQAWAPRNSLGAGSSGGTPVGGGALGGTVSTSGGGISLTGSTATIVLFVAGDLITLPATMPTAAPITLVHDLQRSGQPTPEDLENNAAFVQVAGGSTLVIEWPEDRSLAAASKVSMKTTGAVYTVVADGGSSLIIRAYKQS